MPTACAAKGAILPHLSLPRKIKIKIKIKINMPFERQLVQKKHVQSTG
jgi:hypothetical protein